MIERGIAIAMFVLVGSPASAPQPVAPGLYDITTEIGMPHLEANLRYATTRDTRCLAEPDLASAFPVLGHVALAGCRLEPADRGSGTISYVLTCAGGRGTTGSAVWRLTEHQLTGTLDVRLGGKNMTFYQRVTARRLGDCPPG